MIVKILGFVFALTILSFCDGRNVFVRMSQGPDSVIKQINSQTFNSREEKLQALRNGLMSQASTSQEPIINFLQTRSGISFQSLWMTNEIYIKSANGSFLSNLQSLFSSRLAGIFDESFATFGALKSGAVRQQAMNYTWGQKKIQTQEAVSALNGNNGAGIIIANIDSGVRGTHQALKDSFLGANGWFDPSGNTTEPNDGNGHGTHVMGTMIGAGGIGVASALTGIKWIACKGCAGSGCAESDLKACGQWMICPSNPDGTNPDCSKTPVVINNSWGSMIPSSVYQSMVDVWRAADIIPVFANGNSGPLCSTTGSPGSYKNVIGVGSTSESNHLSSFSSKGPVDSFFGFFGRIKPDLSAPGEAVYSAWHTSDTAYNTISGTSMAAPHVAGVTGLMFAANKNLTYDKVYEILRKGTTTTGLTPPLIRCSGSIFTRYSYPNNDFGQGLLNALNSVKGVQTQG